MWQIYFKIIQTILKRLMEFIHNILKARGKASKCLIVVGMKLIYKKNAFRINTESIDRGYSRFLIGLAQIDAIINDIKFSSSIQLLYS